MDVRLDSSRTAAVQDRPIATRTPRRLALGTRLALFVALSVATVVVLLTLVGMSMASSRLETDLRETARLTGVALADEIELRTDPVTADSLLPLLRDFMSAAVDLSSISVFRAEQGVPVPLVSTSVVAAPPNALIRQVLTRDEVTWSDATPHIALVGVPMRQADRVTGVVVVAVSLTSVEQLRRAARLMAFGGAAFAIVALTLLIHLLARRLILEPLREIRRVIARARTGDLTVRATLHRTDEMREVADGLNAMLTELDELHRSLNQRVETATEELQQRNEQLLSSYKSVLQLRETAARAQQLATIGQTMANVAHQIGTPLNLVSGHVQLLLQEIADPGLRRRLQIVAAQVQRVESTVRDLLARARPHDERKALNVRTLLERLTGAMGPRLATAGVALDLKMDRDVPQVIADETQLELALLNLVTNALDAMPQGGTLTLGVTRVGEDIQLTIRDSGTGIAPELLPQIFEPWITTKPVGRGSGLGLSITRDVVINTGGTITVSSNPDTGTIFTITLPAAVAAAVS